MDLPPEELLLVPPPPAYPPKATCILLGRFQPLHLGHISLIEEAYKRKHSDVLRICIGSSNRIESPDNPWTWEERTDMIKSWLNIEHPNWEVELIGIPDIDDPPNWVSHATSYHGPPGTLFTSDPDTASLYSEAGWPVEMCELEARDNLQGWRVRSTLKMLSLVNEIEAVRSVLGELLHQTVVEWMLVEDRLRRLAFIGPPVEPVG